MLSFKPTFLLSSFIFIKRVFSSSSLFAVRVVSPAYLRLLVFLPAILIPACASSSPVFLKISRLTEPIRAQQTSMFYSNIVLLIYVNDTIYLLGNLSFFKIHVNHFMARDKCQCYLKIHVVGKGPGASLNFRISPFSN